MILKLTGDRPIFTAVNPTNETHFFVPWELSPTQPIGVPENLASLKELLSREFLDDLVFFKMDLTTAQPMGDEVIDPSLSCYDQKLADGAFVYLSINPLDVMGVQDVRPLAPCTEENVHERLVKHSSVLPWTPFPSSSLRFGRLSEGLLLVGKGNRSVCKPAASFGAGLDSLKQKKSKGQDSDSDEDVDDDGHGKVKAAVGSSGNSWARSVALGTTALDNDTVRSFSVCIRSDPIFVKAAVAADVAAKRAAEGIVDTEGDNNNREDTETTFTATTIGGGEGAAAEHDETATQMSRTSFSTATTATALNQTTTLANALGKRATFDASNHLASSSPAAAAASRVPTLAIPQVAVGLADTEIDLEAEGRQHGNYDAAFMLDVPTGAFYMGTAKRPLFVDGHLYRTHDGMILTFVLDSESGTLNVLQSGKVILVAALPGLLADSLHPCVEMYSEGAIVDLI